MDVMRDVPQGEPPERFIPSSMEGELTEAEHFARYRYAASQVKGKRVLDAGCGMAYGSALLREAGAASVVGIDIATSVLDAVRDDMPDGVELCAGDVTSLDLPDDSFDVVVCFELIEHVEQQDRAVAELRRVLTADGLLIISSPNRKAYVPGNPYHVHEYEPEELRAALSERFAHVRLVRQHGFIGSAVLTDEELERADGTELDGLAVSKVVAQTPGQETYTLALGSDAALPDPPGTMVLTGLVEVRHWVDLYAEQQNVLRRQHEHMDNSDRLLAELGELRDRLREAEQQLAVVPELTRDVERTRAERERQEAVERELEVALHERDEWRAEAERAHSINRGMTSSASWKVTRPVRAAKRLARGRG
jgi:SAM-dependent methyltransferase